MKERWKDIEGYEGLDQVSTFGRIKHLSKTVPSGKGGYHHYTERITKGYPVAEGYLRVTLSKNGKQVSKRVNRLVALAFIPNPDNKKEVNHKNGKKWDNRAWMLEWNTPKENSTHARKTGLYKGKPKKPILQFDLKGNLIKEWDCGLNAGRKLKIARSGICLALKGKLKIFRGFIWKYKE